jgi:hypothetical protein
MRCQKNKISHLFFRWLDDLHEMGSQVCLYGSQCAYGILWPFWTIFEPRQEWHLP